MQRQGLASGAGPQARADYGSRHAALFRGGRGRGTPGCAAPGAPGTAVPSTEPRGALLVLPCLLIRAANRAGVSV